MAKLRIVARLDVKNNYVIKGIQLEGLRKVGDPIDLALKYFKQGADEIVFMDAVASLYERNNLFHIIEEACKNIFVPITIGGGIRTLSDIELALKSGADKIALNTAAIRNPNIITEAAKIYGSQCIVGSVEAKKKNNGWEAYVDNGREETGLDAVEWCKKLQDMGAGEIMVTSIDRDGTKSGYDNELVSKINSNVQIPVMASGGAGRIDHIHQIINSCNKDLSAVAIASILHYGLSNIGEIKASLGKKKHSSKTMKKVGIIDYGIGNVKSIQNAITKIAAEPVLTNSLEELLACDCVILPGVGAFNKGMENLTTLGLVEVIHQLVKAGIPFLGICLGMQMLFEESEEFGITKGLGYIKGTVKKIPTNSRLPHIGWTEISQKGTSWEDTILGSIPEESDVYFVHTFSGVNTYISDCLAVCTYDGIEICATVKKGNVYGTQFHPEKSGNIGLEILKKFVEL